MCMPEARRFPRAKQGIERFCEFAFGGPPVTDSHMRVRERFLARHLANPNSTPQHPRWSGQRQVKVTFDKE